MAGGYGSQLLHQCQTGLAALFPVADLAAQVATDIRVFGFPDMAQRAFKCQLSVFFHPLLIQPANTRRLGACAQLAGAGFAYALLAGSRAKRQRQCGRANQNMTIAAHKTQRRIPGLPLVIRTAESKSVGDGAQFGAVIKNGMWGRFVGHGK